MAVLDMFVLWFVTHFLAHGRRLFVAVLDVFVCVALQTSLRMAGGYLLLYLTRLFVLLYTLPCAWQETIFP